MGLGHGAAAFTGSEPWLKMHGYACGGYGVRGGGRRLRRWGQLCTMGV
jgi:hypothetical protein